MVCAACSANVKQALMTLEGVKEVRITVSNHRSWTPQYPQSIAFTVPDGLAAGQDGSGFATFR